MHRNNNTVDFTYVHTYIVCSKKRIKNVLFLTNWHKLVSGKKLKQNVFFCLPLLHSKVNGILMY